MALGEIAALDSPTDADQPVALDQLGGLTQSRAADPETLEQIVLGTQMIAGRRREAEIRQRARGTARPRFGPLVHHHLPLQHRYLFYGINPSYPQTIYRLIIK